MWTDFRAREIDALLPNTKVFEQSIQSTKIVPSANFGYISHYQESRISRIDGVTLFDIFQQNLPVGIMDPLPNGIAISLHLLPGHFSLGVKFLKEQ